MVEHCSFPGCVEVRVGEIMDFYEALSWVKHLNMERTIIEGDAKVVADVIQSSSSSCSIFYDNVLACKEIFIIPPWMFGFFCSKKL